MGSLSLPEPQNSDPAPSPTPPSENSVKEISVSRFSYKSELGKQNAGLKFSGSWWQLGSISLPEPEHGIPAPSPTLPSEILMEEIPASYFPYKSEMEKQDAEVPGDAHAGAKVIPIVEKLFATDVWSLGLSGPAPPGYTSPCPARKDSESASLPPRSLRIEKQTPGVQLSADTHTGLVAGATLISAKTVKVLPPAPECTKLPSELGAEYENGFPSLSGDKTLCDGESGPPLSFCSVTTGPSPGALP